METASSTPDTCDMPDQDGWEAALLLYLGGWAILYWMVVSHVNVAYTVLDIPGASAKELAREDVRALIVLSLGGHLTGVGTMIGLARRGSPGWLLALVGLAVSAVTFWLVTRVVF